MDAPAALPKRRHGETLWPARVALIVVISLQVVLHARVQAAPGLFVPSLETLLLASLVTVRVSFQRRLRRLERTLRLEEVAHLLPHPPRLLTFLVLGVMSLVNFTSLALLINAMIHGSRATAKLLLVDAGNIWITNMIVFAVWYWELDRGGPLRRGTKHEGAPDFLFSVMTAPPGVARPGWRPSFTDYLFLSCTNATAFSPTDTLPLTAGSKWLMMLQALTSFLTVAFVAARAVNILS